jgi:colanic acid/amylovoran biosynthesis glycosyltransferase
MSEMTSVLQTSTLMLCPSVGLWQIGNGLYFDRKFHDGVLAYIAYWPGFFRLAIRLEKSPPPEFGLVQFNADTFPAKVTVLGSDEKIDSNLLECVDIVLASGDSFDNFHLAALCRRQGIKCVYGIEYTLRTRLQIEAIKGLSSWRTLKTMVWLVLKERKRLQAFRLADGLQANGVPAYDAYASLVPNALQYFDTRNTAAMGITDADLSTRLATLDERTPLRLGFSGRMIRMKGADHLIEIAHQLQKRHILFSFDIFGTGELIPQMREKIEEYDLVDSVRLRGVVDFASELVPFIKSNLDLFISCHRQSDPSCTYLETYACGVPIVGYNNRAYQCILANHDVGWSVAMNDIEGLADLIARLNIQRDEIKIKAINAATFAREHTFEATFQSRISHCVDILQQ